MDVPTGTTQSQAPARVGPDDAQARALYEDYRRRQSVRLLSLLSRDAVRPLYRKAREWSGHQGRVTDPMALLLAYCDELLPLPPFEIWRADRAARPAAHLDDEAGPGAARSPSGPATVEIRTFEASGTSWNAALDIRPDGDVWRGHITFRSRDDRSRPHPTGEIFREEDARGVRDRFLDFDDSTLRAFLRSALP